MSHYNVDMSKLPGLTTGHVTNTDNPFEPFFGPTTVQDGMGVKASDQLSHETFNLPDYYKGRNLYLADILEFLITRTDDWYTSRVLPFRYTDQINVAWSVWRFNKTLADLEPHQGVPRYVTAESEEHSDRLLRRGLAFIIEHGFWQTERGRKHYLMNLEQITSAVHETCYYGVLHALLAGKNHWKEWGRQYGRRVHRIDDLLRLERNRFATAQKTERGMYLLDAEIKDMFLHMNIQPDTIILPSKMSIYLTMVPSTEVEYIRAGKNAAVTNNNDMSAEPRDMVRFRGSTVCETRPFDVDFTNQPTELLKREKMIGEYYSLLAHASPSNTEYTSDHRSIYIFNMDVDRFEKIGLEECLDNCFRFDNTDPSVANGLAGNVDRAHHAILEEYGMPSARDISNREDPLFCHHANELNDVPDGVCTMLGDLPLQHFRNINIMEWAETLRRSFRNRQGHQDPSVANVLAWYLNTVLGQRATFVGGNWNVAAAGNAQDKVAASAFQTLLRRATVNATTIGPDTSDNQDTRRGGKGSGATVVPGDAVEINHRFASASSGNWDPSLVSAVFGENHPQVSLMPEVSTSELVSNYMNSFPRQWSSLLEASDFETARSEVSKEAKEVLGTSGENAALEVISSANDKYGEILSRLASSKQSNVESGILKSALSEMESPVTRKRLSSDQKEAKEFVSNFEATSTYWQRENDALTTNADVLNKIINNYVKNMNAEDSALMQHKIVEAVNGGITITNEMLDSWASTQLDSTAEQRLTAIANKLKPAGARVSKTNVAAPGGGRGGPSDPAIRDSTNRDLYRVGKGGITDGALTTHFRDEIQYATEGRVTDANLSREMKARFDQMNLAGGSLNVRVAGLTAASSTNDFYKIAFMLTKVHKRNLQRFIEFDILFPFGFLCMRPFMRYDMASAIYCKAGEDLGVTFMGHNDFQLTDDIIHKTHIGHYTFYSKSVIHNEKNYTIVEDIFSCGYKGGEDTSFYETKQDLSRDMHAENFDRSIICSLLPYRTNEPQGPRIHNPIDLTGKLHPTLYQDTDISQRDLEVSMYPGARYLCEYLELKKLSSYTSDATETFLSPFKYLNTIAFQGAQYMYNAHQGQWCDRIQNTGHWGPNVYNGCKGVRCGDNAFLKEVDISHSTPM